MLRGRDLTAAPFRPEHLARFTPQPAQAHVIEHLTPAYLAELTARGPAYSVFAREECIFCGGIREYGADHGLLWTLISANAGRHFIALHRGVDRFLDSVARPGLFATCQQGFIAGQRWLVLLGFQFQEAIGPYGLARVPHDLYRRVR